MYFYNFNIGDYRSHTAHLTPTEHYIYRSLIDWYYLNERPMPANDIDYIARVLMLKTDDERQALQSVLSAFFKVKKLKLTGDTVECYHHARIDNEIKNYHHANGGRVYDHTREVTQGNDIGNIKSNVGNVSGNVQNVTNDKKGNVLTQAERTAKSKAERKKIIADLQESGADFDPNADMKTLRELHANFFGANFGNVRGNVGNETGNVGNSESNAFHDAITNNQEPITNNQDKNNTTPREQNFDIRDWVEPEYSDFIEILQDNDIHMALPQDLYLAESQKFKGYNANLAAQGKVSLVDDSYRMTKFIDWFKILANKQHASKQAVAAPVVHDDDLPEIYRQSSQSDQTYHPSHAPVAPAKKLPGMFSAYGQNYMPLEGMDAKGTFEAVTEKMGKFYTFAEAYQILKDELSGAFASISKKLETVIV